MESFTKRSRSPSKLSSPRSPLKRSLSEIFGEEYILDKFKINLKYISGPIAWTGFEFANKAIHFFGDRHFSREGNCEEYYGVQCSSSKDYDPNSECMTIDGLIKAIFETSDKKGFYADFFMESPYETKKIKPRQSIQPSHIGYFADVYEYNIERIHSGKANSKTKFHPIDIRTDWTICNRKTKKCERLPLDLFTYISVQLIHTEESEEIKKEYGNDIVDLFQKGLLDYYKSDNYIVFIENLIKQLSNWKNKTSLHKNFLSHLKKILKHVTTQGIAGKKGNSIFQTIKMLESLNKKQITFKGINISEYIQDFFEKEKDEYVKNVKHNPHIDLLFLLEIGAALMDISTLTKIFKRLENDEPQVMIVFTGNDHIKSYVKFFREVLGLKPLPGSVLSANPEHIRCLVNPKFSTIFGRWIEGNKMPPSETGDKRKTLSDMETLTPEKKSKRKKSNVTPPKLETSRSGERKSKRISTPRQSKKETTPSPKQTKRETSTPRKSRRVSKPIENFSKQYGTYY